MPEWPLDRDGIADLLGVKVGTIGNYKARYDLRSPDHFFIASGQRKSAPPMVLYTQAGVVEIARNLRTDKARTFLEMTCPLDQRNNQPVRIEHLCIDLIQEAMEGLTTCKKQFPVGAYRVDLYLPDLRLVVECDEISHSNYSKQREMDRQEQISNELDCEFLRFNPSQKGFRMGPVLNAVFKKFLTMRSNQEVGDSIP